MSRRSRAREVALQILFEDDVNPRATVAEMKQFVSGRLNNMPELEEFCMSLILGVRRNQAELDAQLAKIGRRNWSISRPSARGSICRPFSRAVRRVRPGCGGRRGSATCRTLRTLAVIEAAGDERLHVGDVARGFTSSSKRICRATSRARLAADMAGENDEN